MRLLLVAGAGIALTAMLTSLSGLPGEPPSREGLPWKVADVMLAGLSWLSHRIPISGTDGALDGRRSIGLDSPTALHMVAEYMTTAGSCGDAGLGLHLVAIPR